MNALARTVRRARRLVVRPEKPVNGPIGVDLSLKALHMVQVAKATDGNLSIRACASVPYQVPRDELLESPQQLRSVVRRALASADFAGGDVVLTLPATMFRTMSINYRASSGEAEVAAVARAIGDRLDGDLADYVIDFVPVRARARGADHLALVAVSEREPVVSFLEAFRKAGLRVAALEIGPVAITRLVRTLAADAEEQNVLVVNTGRRSSYLTLISGHDLLFDQEVRVGEESLVARVAETLDLSPMAARNLIMSTGAVSDSGSPARADDKELDAAYETLAEILKPKFMVLVEEIKRAFLYAAAETRGGGVSRVYLLGSVARWPGSDLLLNRLAGINVTKIPDPLKLFRNGDGVAQGSLSAPNIAVASGLALRGLVDDE